MLTKERFLFLKEIMKSENKIIKDIKAKNKINKLLLKVLAISALTILGVFFHSISIGGLSVHAYIFLSILCILTNIGMIVAYHEFIVKSKILKQIKNTEVINFIDFYEADKSHFLKIDELRNQLSKEEKSVLVSYYRNLKNWESAAYLYFNNYIKNETHSVLEKNKEELVNLIKNELSNEKNILCVMNKLNEKINEEIPKQIEELEYKILNKEKNVLNINTI